MNVALWQVVIGTVGVSLTAAQARHGGIGLGRRSRLEQRIKHLSDLLEKLPEDAYGRKKVGALLRQLSYQLAYLMEFPRITSQLATGASSMSAAIIGVFGAWLIESHPTTPAVVTNLLSAAGLVAIHIYITSDRNARMLNDCSRELFQYVDGEPGMHRMDVRPGLFFIHYQPYTRDVEARAQEIAEADQIPLAQAAARAWNRADREINARCRWYHRFIWTRLPLEFFAWLGDVPLVPYDRDENPYEVDPPAPDDLAEPSGQAEKA
ncbi:hypothetical protein BKG86_17135 [Mycobacteroides chelonae]|uniref:hypothetical protein n=1 Tax=Mycobacteroides chelonae TaxID=1774 RepID=UPI0008A91D11|nr:hypothetical protein [Mycobacteroides chelonae]OHU71378.1 hypothetical protein BKG86_17135 [Mycobacteroides chelonae]